MGRWHRQQYTQSEILAVGIEGDCSALCGAIKRFQRRGRQSNNPLSLKEQCARHIARIENDQTKWFLSYHLPMHLFKYVTKDLFNLRREDFVLNYANDFDLCEACSTDSGQARRIKCRCPQMERAMEKLNRYFYKRMNKEKKVGYNKVNKFELIYKLPHVDDDDYSDYCDQPPLFFIYLSPCIFQNESRTGDSDDDSCPYHDCRTIEAVSAEDKLLFVDLMRFFGPFQTNHNEPKLVLYNRSEQGF